MWKWIALLLLIVSTWNTQTWSNVWTMIIEIGVVIANFVGSQWREQPMLSYIVAEGFNPAGIHNGDQTMGALGVFLLLALILWARGRG